MADPLVSLETYKTADGDVNPSVPSAQDATFERAIRAASDLVRAYTGLKFELSDGGPATPRLFEYDGSGYLDIHEARNIASITTQGGYTGSIAWPLTSDEWSAYPLNMPVKLWLRLPNTFYGRGISPEMGFTYNLDTLGYRDLDRPNIVTVTAEWGWPEIPDDVQQAVIWTAATLAEKPRPFQQESIENYSRTRGSESQHEAIPERAQVALLPYVIPAV